MLQPLSCQVVVCVSPPVSDTTAVVDFVKTSVQYSVNNQSFAETLLYFTYPSHLV